VALLVGIGAAQALLFGPGRVACPFGADPVLPALTVCDRALGGLWLSVAVGLGAGIGAALAALALALLARTFRGPVDTLVAKGADLVFALPDVLVLLLIGFALTVLRDARGLRPDPVAAMILSLVAIGWAAPTRMIQERLRSLEREEFVAAAEAVGATRWRILTRHLLPFAWEYLLAVFLLRVPAAILAESTVSFLGFGLPGDRASLGTYLGEATGALMRGEWRIVLPAWGSLLLVVLAFQWSGQAVLARAAGPGSGAR
jgi:peptide/nickel transport system permease protein